MPEINVYEGIMQGLSEAIAYKNGDVSKARVRVLSTVDSVNVSVFKPDEIATLRRNLNISQRGLATAIGVSPRTVEAWEAGKSTPSGVAMRMLYLINADNSLVDKLVVRNQA